jgi:hypothetical protein
MKNETKNQGQKIANALLQKYLFAKKVMALMTIAIGDFIYGSGSLVVFCQDFSCHQFQT